LFEPRDTNGLEESGRAGGLWPTDVERRQKDDTEPKTKEEKTASQQGKDCLDRNQLRVSGRGRGDATLESTAHRGAGQGGLIRDWHAPLFREM
jgi:hypothetical protein